ncbi:molybdate ABC transporter substrate-binding protein [Paracoccus albus]|uniref:molybdate ABC transporter substrate-binding protein n=1 Tax=Paracoccus albus TaxID=3017784 RepID=UPI0022EFEE5D|nr:molybdate ABC transporter substrate-binding protein [Paracoccus albus]WBU61581.1 molybdate ABC transporter substrate-binding protein [Paracoccus albus]
MRFFHLISAVMLGAAFPADAEQVTVFAAASLKTALDEVAQKFTKQTGNEVVISYAGSNALARQIIAGAPADIFISANVAWMDEIEKAGQIQAGKRRDLLGNSLVLIAHGDAAPVEVGPELDLPARLGDEKLAMALVDSVPAGQYGKAALESLGLWDGVSASVAQADNVRAALALVATGEAPFGIVYATDAKAEDAVQLIGTFPAESYPPIVYPAAVLKEANDAADQVFFDMLSSPDAAAIFEQQGFTVID